VFGELSFLDGGARSASVVVVEDLEALAVDRDDLDHLFRIHPEAGTCQAAFGKAPNACDSSAWPIPRRLQSRRTPRTATQPRSSAVECRRQMATPHASSVAALVWSLHAGCTAEQIRASLNKSALDLGAAGRDNVFGFGLVQAKAAHDRITALGCGA